MSIPKTKFVVVSCPYTRQRGHMHWLDAWRCNFCPRVHLTLAAIRKHCFVEHGIWMRPKGSD
jgi:hypothetical protein